MNAQELLNEWKSGESTGVRPERVKALRSDLRRYTDVPIPRSTSEIENWLPRMKGQITKDLQEAVEIDEDAGDDDEGAGETSE